jgi:hypothetical protein
MKAIDLDLFVKTRRRMELGHSEEGCHQSSVQQAHFYCSGAIVERVW